MATELLPAIGPVVASRHNWRSRAAGVKQIEDRAGEGIEGLISEAAEVPVVARKGSVS
jgi:hypothetical protein